MRNIKLIIEYDGTDYSGWQIQKNAKTIQEEIQKAIYKITDEKVNLTGAGRTDAGVHAKGQVANFTTASKIKDKQFAWALNSVLSEDIIIKDSIEVPMNFHSCFDAKSKIYGYTIYTGTFPSAIMRNYIYHLRYNRIFDIEKTKRAAGFFIGTHDFKGFMAADSNVKSTVRTIYDIEFCENKDVLEIIYHGNGFLYNMIRIITGTLINAGIGKTDVEKMPEIIAAGNRELAGITVPPHGLCLKKVFY